MLHNLRTLLIVMVLLPLVLGFGVAMAVAHRVALEDALIEELDRPTVTVVTNYLDQTWLPRSAGYALIAGFWVMAGIGIGRLISPAVHGRP